MPEETLQTLQRKGWGNYKRAGTGSPTRSSLGFAGSGIAGSSDAKNEALQSQLAGAQALQRRTMAALGAGDISKDKARDTMGDAMDKIQASVRGIATLDPANYATYGGQKMLKSSLTGLPLLTSSGKEMYDNMMRNVTGARGSNFDNIIRGVVREGQNIGGRTIGAGAGS